MTQFLPSFPLHTTPLISFAFILLLGFIAGELVKYTRFLPKIFGYIAIGFLIGPDGLNIVTHSLLVNSKIFIDISLGIILFELGRHLDFSWLRYDRALLPTSITESGLTFVLVFLVLHFFGLSWLQAALGGTIAIATSPAVVMTVAYDLASVGPVTRRTLILTSLNNLFALVIFSFLLPISNAHNLGILNIFMHIFYRLFGSMILVICLLILMKLLARLTGKQKESQFILFLGIVLLTIGIASILNLSTLLTLFILGVAARNFDHEHLLMEVNFGWLARIFFILLFVITGVYLKLGTVSNIIWIALTLIFIRLIAKITGLFFVGKYSRLTKKQSLAISFALTPMAGVAIGMTTMLTDFNPNFGTQLNQIISFVIALLTIIGPVVTQLAFLKTGEAYPMQTEGRYNE
ncbi:MAG: cation:proton antiporter [Proteobacteria bacterium]|nr:cation:proton antiporter [Pseudomonadota bacterium]